MRIGFNETEHCYSVNGEIANISVTELLRKHKLSPDFSGVSKEVLMANASEGTKVHRDIEDFINDGFEPTTKQAQNFKEWVLANVQGAVAEQRIGYVNNGFSICGTADIIGFLKDGKSFIGDHKNVSTLSKESVTWQVNLLDYMFRHNADKEINGKPFVWNGADYFYCFKYDKETGDMKVIELDRIPDNEIERLIDCERKGDIFQRAELSIAEELQLQVEQAEEFLALKEKEYKQAKENAQKLRESLISLFEKQKITKWETDKVRVTYIPEIEKMQVDSTKLKRDFPVAYTNCLKIVHQKAQIRIKIKDNEDTGQQLLQD